MQTKFMLCIFCSSVCIEMFDFDIKHFITLTLRPSYELFDGDIWKYVFD